VPFREAHGITGRIVALAEAKGVRLDELPLETMRSVEPRIGARVFDVLTVENSVASRTSYGGTAPQSVKKMASAWIKRLERELAAV
jgi:argininosuccinate lyase